VAAGPYRWARRGAATMRKFTFTQDIETDVADHWRLFLDDDHDRAQFLEGLRYPSYELVERVEDETSVRRTIKVTPRLEVPAAVAKLLGDGFGYTEVGTFDKQTQLWRAVLTPNMLGGKLRSEVVLRAEPAGERRCRRTCDAVVEAKLFAVGGLVESSLESNVRTGWTQAAAYMNRKLAAARG
jgi:Protein of unknown function (DUF2505)